MGSLEQRRAAFEGKLAVVGQQHVFAFWEGLSDEQRSALLEDLERIDLDRCVPLIDSHVRRGMGDEAPAGSLEPAPVWPERATGPQELAYTRAARLGAAALREGRVAAFTVAGGHGTRLGYDGPKGGFAITPVRNRPLFALFAGFLRGIGRRYGRVPRWYIMTSSANHDATRELFRAADWFGLVESELFFFQQGEMPVFHLDGRIGMAARHRLALSPDGHGGSLRALAVSGALEDMQRHGVDTISYFQVDNPLARPIDPLFIGLHLMQESEMSSKAVRKADDFEKVGVFCLADRVLKVIEYTDLPSELATSRSDDGARRFDAGNIAIHLLSREFVQRLTEQGAAASLPWHRAIKKVPLVDPQGTLQSPGQPNAVKLEQFVFDAIPLARNPLVLYTSREDEFSPVKNAEGVDSPASARRDQVRRAARWLEACGVTVPRAADGEPLHPIEIDPAIALDVEDLRAWLAEHPLGVIDGPVFLG